MSALTLPHVELRESGWLQPISPFSESIVVAPPRILAPWCRLLSKEDPVIGPTGYLSKASDETWTDCRRHPSRSQRVMERGNGDMLKLPAAVSSSQTRWSVRMHPASHCE